MHATLVAVLLLAAAAAAAAAPSSTSAGKADVSDYRLSGDVVPSHYTVQIVLPLGTAALDYFEGVVDITASVVRATNSIALHHADNIQVNTTSVIRKNGADVTWESEWSPTLDLLTIYLNEQLEQKEEINIRIKYTAQFPDRMEGFYKSFYKYTNNEGEEYERVLFATQFEPIYARKALPAFDEPGYKATFQLTIDTPPGFNALSNTPLEDRIVGNVAGRKTERFVFLETPQMPLYILAFIVYEEISYINAPTVVSSVPITSWAPKDDIDAGQAEFSQNETPKILSIMEEFTGIPFAHGNLQKIDEVAIPDFTAGAMENWGLITYREDTLLVDPKQSTERDRLYVSEVISHEIAHQWFGNLVTPEWWDSVWLNEGFARYFQYWIVAQLHPDWRMDEQLLVDIQQSIFEADALPSARALTTEVNTPDEIVERLGTMSYSKGSAVVRMIKNIMGEENFKKALQFYLQENAFGNVKPQHLFSALDAHMPSDAMPSSLDLSTVLETWTEIPGFPVLSVDAWNSNTLFVTQKRFYLSSEESSSEEYFIQFQIHLQSGASTARLWSGPGLSKQYVEVASTEQWLVVNSTGYFRVNYWPENWQRLGAALRERPGAVAPEERAQLVDDALNLARAALLPYSTALDLVRYLERDTDYMPWKASFAGLDFLGRLLANVDEEGVFSAFLLELLDGVYAHLGFVDEGSHLDKRLRTQVLERACRAGRADCLQAAQERLTAFLQEGRDVVPDLKSVVYCYGVKAEGNSVWEELLVRLQLTDSPGERNLLITSLGCSDNVETLKSYLKYSLDPSVVRQQDAAAVFSSVYANPFGVDPALDFLVGSFEDIKQAYGAMRDINNIVRGIAAQLSNEEQQTKMVNFVKEHRDELGESGEVAVNTVNANVQWLSERKDEVLNAMKPTHLT